MRQVFAHEAVLIMEPGADTRAPGAAVTVALCGHWSHEPQCPLAPHHVAVEQVDAELRVRVLFATQPYQERTVRDLVEQALSGQTRLPDGIPIQWRLRSSMPTAVSTDETPLADRLIRS